MEDLKAEFDNAPAVVLDTDDLMKGKNCHYTTISLLELRLDYYG